MSDLCTFHWFSTSTHQLLDTNNGTISFKKCCLLPFSHTLVCLHVQSCSWSGKFDVYPAQSSGPVPEHQKGSPDYLPSTTANKHSWPVSPAWITHPPKLRIFCQCKNKTNFLESSAKAHLKWCSVTKSKITANVFWRLSRVTTCPLLKFPNYYLICYLKLVSVRNTFSLVLHWGLIIVVWPKCPAHVTNHNFYI